ncbi:hypothetical protein PVK06_019987 [Gossypium arboreum]|uniref:Uncharacterized protein n=1 Tax=Gossypium arboreum TaxID=29729 RepID=A0ABR0PL63_GOSAR|nr:hypothetical protein PVK06_019987 [Gossypium arboreum]
MTLKRELQSLLDQYIGKGSTLSEMGLRGASSRGWWSKLEQFFEVESALDHAKVRKDHFGSDTYLDPIEELVSLKQHGIVDQYHDLFVSLLNQLHLPESLH